MPCHLISDAQEWINEISTVPIYYLAKSQVSSLISQNSAITDSSTSLYPPLYSIPKQLLRLLLPSFTSSLCNSAYYNLPKSQMTRFQQIENSLARDVVKDPKSFIPLPSIRCLHWLKRTATASNTSSCHLHSKFL